MTVETAGVPLGGGPAAPAEGAKPGAGVAEEVTKKPGEGEEPKKPEGETVAAGEGEKKEGEGEAAPLNPADALKKTEEPPKTDAQLQAEQATGLDLTAYSNEFTENGKLSDESYAELAKRGIPRPTVDLYIKGVQAQVAERNVALAEAVGGAENFNAIIQWGATKLSNEEKAGAVRMLSGPDTDAARTYLKGLHARFVEENGRTPAKQSGGGTRAAEDVFASRSEQAKAMNDPRYQSDAAYRQAVVAKSIRSFSEKGAKKRSKKSVKPRSKKAASKTTRRARSKGKR